MAIEDDFPQLMSGEGEMVESVALPSESHLSDIRKRIEEAVAGEKDLLVTVQTWGEKSQIVSCREGSL